jgi:hypothetical protein
MVPVLIGIFSGLFLMLLFGILKHLDKRLIYGLILVGIGFIYVGFVWTNLQALLICSLQAIVFLFLAYYGIKKSMNILAAGYFLHGCWDMAYHYFGASALIPPHYDWFCLSIDFTMGIYLLGLNKWLAAKKIPS